MLTPKPIQPVDYLIIGHITQDLISSGSTIGGTAAYAARTANALGCRVGVVSAHAEELDNELLDGVEIYNIGAESSTTFSNLDTPAGRIQSVHAIAPVIKYQDIPDVWRKTPLVHLGPVLHEIDHDIVRNFRDSELFITPQGWFRSWDKDGFISATKWPEAKFVLEKCRAAVLSEDDIAKDEQYAQQLSQYIDILIITKGNKGLDLYYQGFKQFFKVKERENVDNTGAGDIFASSFFVHFSRTKDLKSSIEFAQDIAADSVLRTGLNGAPSKNDLFQNLY